MKHNLKITLIIIGLFLVSQLILLGTLNFYIKAKTPVIKQGKVVGYNISYKEMPNVAGTKIVEQATIPKPSYGFLPILIIMLIGTIILFLLIKYKKFRVWRLWYFLAVVICLFIAFYPFIYYIISLLGFNIARLTLTQIKHFKSFDILGTISFIFALVIAYFKVYKKHIMLHNLSELFVYPGLVIIILPIFNVISAIILLILISLYDIFAVWKSKHMIKLAKGMMDQQSFAGLFIPYHKNKVFLSARKSEKKIKNKKENNKSKEKSSVRKIKITTAVLGGGDVAFPMIFNGVMYNVYGIQAIITIITSSLALAALLFFAKKKRFYPAMPYLTVGCLIGYAIIKIL